MLRARRILIYLMLFLALLPATLAQASLFGFGMSTDEEIDLGRSVARQVEKRYGLVTDAALQERVTRIGNNLAAVADRKGLPYTFKVLNCKDINAFALPGGFIYINKGLIDYLSTDDELAGVIGHELGHVVKRHIIKQMEKAEAYSIGLLVAFGDKGIALQSLALEVVMAGYSRGDESEADYLGFVHTQRAGYNPYSMLIGLQRLGELGDDANFDLFSDHPETSVRISKVEGYLRDAKISPVVTLTDKAARISGPGLDLPPLYATYQGVKPLYRAELAAGVLYQLSKRPELSGDRFIVDPGEIYTTIYYEDRQVVVLTPQDASSNKTSLEGLANRYVEALKTWADKKAWTVK
jgi:beta-barrel assembly-enhancing protease